MFNEPLPSLELEQTYEARKQAVEAEKAWYRYQLSGMGDYREAGGLQAQAQRMFEVINSTPNGQLRIMENALPKPVPQQPVTEQDIGNFQDYKKWMEDRGLFEEATPDEVMPFDPVTYVFDTLAVKEGEGDKLTDVETGKLGVTDWARRSTGLKDAPDEEVAQAYLQQLDGMWKNRLGYDVAPPAIKAMLLDATYNMGENVLQFKSVQDALKNEDYPALGKALLDTANVNKMTVKGLAKRRAEGYNIANPEAPITEVEQTDDGYIIYRLQDGQELLKYKASKGRHPSSEPGIIEVPRA